MYSIVTLVLASLAVTLKIQFSIARRRAHPVIPVSAVWAVESCELGKTSSWSDAEVFIADDDEKTRALRVVIDLRILRATSLLTDFIMMALCDPPPAPLFSAARSVVSR
jgi:hypothetical protein